MRTLVYTFALMLVVSVASFPVGNESISQDLYNKIVQRIISIDSPLVTIKYSMVMENAGNQTLSGFLFCLEENMDKHLSYLTALSVGDTFNTKLRLIATQIQEFSDLPFWYVYFATPLAPQQMTSVEIEAVFCHRLMPYPPVIRRHEFQYVMFKDSHFFYTPYRTDTQYTDVYIETPRVMSYTFMKPAAVREDHLHFGPYKGVAPFSVNRLAVHYEYNKPLLVVRNLDRVIKVSHWGKIFVQDFVELEHQGAELEGVTDLTPELDNLNPDYPSVGEFRTKIPSSARDIYVKGNDREMYIAERDVKKDFIDLSIAFSMPLIGGNVVRYQLGYVLPVERFLWRDNDDHVLKMPLLDHVSNGMVVDVARVQVILPEGSDDMWLYAPYSVHRDGRTKLFSALHPGGQTVTTVTVYNAVEKHAMDFELYYTFDKLLLLQLPATLSAVILSCLLAVLAFRKYVSDDVDYEYEEDVAIKETEEEYREEEQTLFFKNSGMGDAETSSEENLMARPAENSDVPSSVSDEEPPISESDQESENAEAGLTPKKVGDNGKISENLGENPTPQE